MDCQGGRKRQRTIQIFANVDGSKALPLELSPRDKVGDIVSRIPTARATANRKCT